MLPMVLIWAMLALTLAGLVLARKFTARNEDDYIHLSDPRLAARQTQLAMKLDWLDRWGKALTSVVVIYGLMLAAWYLYASWQATGQLVP